MVSLLRQALRRVAPQPERRLEVGSGDAEVARERGGDADVLRHQGELETRSECAGENLPRDLPLGRVIPARRGVDRLQHRVRIEAEAAGDEQGLEAGDGAGGAEIIVQRLYRVPGAKGADVDDVLSQRLQNRQDL